MNQFVISSWLGINGKAHLMRACGRPGYCKKQNRHLNHLPQCKKYRSDHCYNSVHLSNPGNIDKDLAIDFDVIYFTSRNGKL